MEVGGAHIELGRPFEFWTLCTTLLVAYFWSLRKHGPLFHPAPDDPPATWWQKLSFTSGVVSLFLVSGTVWHDIGEQGLFFFHTTEHMVQAFVAAPLILLGIPDWMFRMLVRIPVIRFVVERAGRPLPAALVFNAAFALLHWPQIVDWMLETSQIHGAVHMVWIATSLLMWLPTLSPAEDVVPKLSPPAQMGYLLTMTILPTVPSSFLTFGEEPAYRVYEALPRMWAIPAVEDMQISGLIMKIGGGLLMWLVIAVKFFRWAAAENRAETAHRRGRGGPGDGGSRPDPSPAAPAAPVAPVAPEPTPAPPAPVG